MTPLPRYDLEKIKFATDPPTFKRAIDLYEKGKVTQFSVGPTTYFAIVKSTQDYEIVVSAIHYDEGRCDCYLGQRDTLCKHMVAVAIYAVKQGRTLSQEESRPLQPMKCSGKVGELSPRKLKEIKQHISGAMRKIKPYYGPSRIWFAYQDSLTEGANRLTAIFSALPVSRQTAKLIIQTLLKLDKRLSVGGVDDSDGTVGDLIQDSVQLLMDFAVLDQSVVREYSALEKIDSVFDWEEPLVELYHRSNDGQLSKTHTKKVATRTN